MASNEGDREIRCLYSDYATTVDKFKEENDVLLVNYELEDLGDDAGYKLYSEFSKENDGELARELVQTWICDHRLEVTNCVCIALDNRKQSFCNWFRDSEQYSSLTNFYYIVWGSKTISTSVFSTANMCGRRCQNIYGMTTLKLLNTATLFSCSWENGITPYFVRKVTQWMNLHVPATHLREVGAEPVHVLA